MGAVHRGRRRGAPGDPRDRGHATDADGLVDLVGELAAHTGGQLRLAFLFSRPGSSAPDEHDRAWARVLYDAMAAAGMRREVVHVATDAVLVPVALDDAGPRPGRQPPAHRG